MKIKRFLGHTPPNLSKSLLALFLAVVLLVTASPASAAVSDNLEVVSKTLNEWLGVGKESVVPTDDQYPNASLVEKVNYIENQVDEVFQYASNGKTLLASKLSIDTSNGLPTYEDIHEKIEEIKSTKYGDGYDVGLTEGEHEGYIDGMSDGLPELTIPKVGKFYLDGYWYTVCTADDDSARVVYNGIVGNGDYISCCHAGECVDLDPWKVLRCYYNVSDIRMVKDNEIRGTGLDDSYQYVWCSDSWLAYGDSTERATRINSSNSISSIALSISWANGGNLMVSATITMKGGV